MSWGQSIGQRGDSGRRGVGKTQNTRCGDHYGGHKPPPKVVWWMVSAGAGHSVSPAGHFVALWGPQEKSQNSENHGTSKMNW